MTSRARAIDEPLRNAGRCCPRRPTAASLLAAVALTGCVAWAVSATAASTPTATCGRTGTQSALTCTYTTVGSDVFVVPANVSRADFTVVGAMGGEYFIEGDDAHPAPTGNLRGRAGGAGGQATATLRVSAGDVLQVDVAGIGAAGTATSRSGGMENGPSGGGGASGGFGGSDRGTPGDPGDVPGANGGSAPVNGGNGSGGGGASDVRAAAGGCASLTCPLGARLLVGAGGGGSGGIGGRGNAHGGEGGAGGGATGADGPAAVDGGNKGVPGHGAAAGAGGAAGLNPARHLPAANLDDPRIGGDGTDGGAGAGGAGGDGNRPCTDPTLGGQCAVGIKTSGGGAGGGGGGGYFGGGGGSGGGGAFGGGGGAGGGGGGGSSYATADAIVRSLSTGSNNATINNGNGQVTISWTIDSDTPPPSTNDGAGGTPGPATRAPTSPGTTHKRPRKPTTTAKKSPQRKTPAHKQAVTPPPAAPPPPPPPPPPASTSTTQQTAPPAASLQRGKQPAAPKHSAAPAGGSRPVTGPGLTGLLIDSPGQTLPDAAGATTASQAGLERLKSLGSTATSDAGTPGGDGGGWTGWPVGIVACIALLALGARREGHPERDTPLNARTA